MNRFYMTWSRSRPNTIGPWIEENDVPVLTNAVQRWSESRETFLSMWEYDTVHAIDSGGYNVQASFADRWGNLKVAPNVVEEELQKDAPFFPWSVEEYHEWLKSHQDEIEVAFCMDYACEERFDELWSVKDRVDATIENTVRHFELLREDDDADYDLVPVLQGTEVDEWVECERRLRENGVPTEHVGLGTVCRLSSSNKIVEAERGVRENTPVETVHGFGAKIEAFRLGATFDSADSHAWVYGPSNGRCRTLHETEDGYNMDEVEMNDDSFTRTVHSFKVYYAYVTYLMDGEPAVDVDEIFEEQERMGLGGRGTSEPLVDEVVGSVEA